jgi:hypothetical protein
MAKRIKIYSLWVVCFCLFMACKKEGTELESNSIGISSTELEAVNRSIQWKGHYLGTDMPLQTDTGPLLANLLAVRDTIEIGEELPCFIPLSIPDQGFLKLCGMYARVKGAKGVWKVMASNDSVSSDYFVELSVPAFVQAGVLEIELCAQLCISNRTIYTNTVSAYLNVRPALQCGDTLNGSVGLTIRKFNLGPKKGRVKVSISTGNLGDRMDIKFGGKYVLSTCTLPKPGQFPKCNSPAECFLRTGNDRYNTYYFDYDPAVSSFAEVYMLGFCNQNRTLWQIILGCPE